MFRIAFRRSVGRLFFFVIMAVEAIALFAHGTMWTHLWVLSASHVAGGTIIVGPISGAAGAAAFVERRRRQPEMPRQAHLRDSMLRFSALVAWVLLAHLLASFSAYILTAFHHGGLGPYDLRLIGVSSLALMAYSAVGAVIGELFPFWVTVPLVAIGLYLLVFPAVSRMSLLLVGGATGTGGLVGKEYRSAPLGVQALWFLGVATTACGLLVVRDGLLAKGIVGLGLLTAVVAFVQPVPADIIQARSPADLACEGRVCVDNEVASDLPRVRTAAAPAIAAADQLGELLPGRPKVERVVNIYPFEQDSHAVAVDWLDEPPHVDVPALAWSLAQRLSGCSADKANEQDSALQPAVAWISSRTGIEPPDGEKKPTLDEARGALLKLHNECR